VSKRIVDYIIDKQDIFEVLSANLNLCLSSTDSNDSTTQLEIELTLRILLKISTVCEGKRVRHIVTLLEAKSDPFMSMLKILADEEANAEIWTDVINIFANLSIESQDIVKTISNKQV